MYTPAGSRGELQLLDVGTNDRFKNFMKNSFTRWYANEVKNSYESWG